MKEVNFRTIWGKPLNLLQKIEEEIAKNPTKLKIYLGTDAQEIGTEYRYVTAIVFKYGKNGAHVIYSSSKTAKTDNFTKLYTEGIITIDIANYICEHIPMVKSILTLEFDFNRDGNTESSPHAQIFYGWACGLDYYNNVKIVEGKESTMLWSIRAADNLVKSGK